tara:strand:+ start:219 stop:614 length:396 start_codon:yes stop_codon:yes gene_type:complete
MNTKLDKILAEISAGELIDKITILEIKLDKISDKTKVNNVRKELKSLQQTMNKHFPEKGKIDNYINELKKINLKLWDVEDGKRSAEKNQKFDEKFVELARSVYKFNDERARIKLAINEVFGSSIKEVKSHF